MKRSLSSKEAEKWLDLLATRFQDHPQRHPGIAWETVRARLESAPAKLWSLAEMDRSGGEPDLVAVDKKSGAVLFVDCVVESPAGRRSVCYDREGWESRRDHRPETTAMDQAREIGVTLVTEDEYRLLQEVGEFDLKTSSWILTPADVRSRGGALYGEKRYGRIFIGHNGAQSYYAARGWRGALWV